MSAPRIDHYDWPGGREAMLRFGPERGPTVIAALPLFEEANRTRASLVAVLRRLAARGIGGALPDLPGTGESLIPTHEATLADCRTAFAAAAREMAGPLHAVSWRSGALIDGDAEVASRWHLSPASGAETTRDLRRVRAASRSELYAGNRLSREFFDELEASRLPGEGRGPVSTGSHLGPGLRRGSGLVRTIRLESDPRPADAHLPGRPLWRAAEPGTDPALEAALADDIAAWIAR